LDVQDLPLLARRQGVNRSVRDVDDMFTYHSRADEADMTPKLPKFVAADLERVPHTKPEDLDLCALARKVTLLESTVARHSAVIQVVNMQWANDSADHAEHISPRANIPGNIGDKTHSAGSSADGAGDGSLSAVSGDPGSSWADYVAAMASTTDNDGFTTVNRTYKPRPAAWPAAPAARLRGSRAMGVSDPIKTVPHRLTAFVGRLHKDTSSEDLCDYLKSAGIIDPLCTKIVRKDGKLFDSAAFWVSCNTVSKDAFYDEANWPIGCELCDWIFIVSSNTRYDHGANPSNFVIIYVVLIKVLQF